MERYIKREPNQRPKAASINSSGKVLFLIRRVEMVPNAISSGLIAVFRNLDRYMRHNLLCVRLKVM